MNKQSGFTLIELMIVVAIVAILAAIALPAYQSYTTKARFTEVVSAVGPYKTAIEVCAQTNGITTTALLKSTKPDGTNTCFAGGANGVPATIAAGTGTGNVDSVLLDATNLTITAKGKAAVGSYTYILTASATDGKITWAPSGDCQANGAC